MIIVHHLENSRSQRVLWLLEELQVAYDIKRYERDKVTSLAPPELREIHPLGKSPVIVDDGQVIAETGAIIEYLIEKYGGGSLVPAPQSAAKLRYTYWLHFAEGSLMTQLIINLLFTRIKDSKMPFFARPIANKLSDKVLEGYVAPNIKAQLDYMENELGKTKWFAGDDLTGADIMLSFPLEGINSRGALAAYPNLTAFIERIQAREAYRKALARGGTYAFA